MSNISQFLPKNKVQRLTDNFDKDFKKVGQKMKALYGEELTKKILDETRIEYKNVLSQVPFFKGRFTIFKEVIVLNAQIVALFKVMKKYGKTAHEVVSVYYDIYSENFNRVPKIARWIVSKIVNSFVFRTFFRYSAKNVSVHPDGWKIQLYKDNGKENDWYVICTECGVIKFYQKMDVMELAHYCNFFDYLQSITFGLGMNNTECLACGDQRCVQYNKQNRKTTIPKNLVTLVKDN